MAWRLWRGTGSTRPLVIVAYWSRHYRFFRQGKALTVIREVFSPQLETWLGPTLRQEFQQNS